MYRQAHRFSLRCCFEFRRMRPLPRATIRDLPRWAVITGDAVFDSKVFSQFTPAGDSKASLYGCHVFNKMLNICTFAEIAGKCGWV